MSNRRATNRSARRYDSRIRADEGPAADDGNGGDGEVPAQYTVTVQELTRRHSRQREHGEKPESSYSTDGIDAYRPVQK